MVTHDSFAPLPRFGANESLGITATLLNRAIIWTLAAICFAAYAFSRDERMKATLDEAMNAAQSQQKNELNAVAGEKRGIVRPH